MKKNVNINDLINEIMFRSNYRINESAKYHQVIDNNEEFDEFPKEISEADDELPPVTAPTEKPAEDGIDPAIDPTQEVPKHGLDPNPADMGDPNNIPDMPNNFDQNNPEVLPEEQITVDDIQNDIIKTNLETMKYIHDQMKELDRYVKSIDTKMSVLTADVEEVRAPSNGEKLMAQKKVSYPYYYNLNDYWQDNSFEHKQEEENFGHGIKKLDDGTFIADFDDLPKNVGNIDKSFTDY